jgi:hypothetical protein
MEVEYYLFKKIPYIQTLLVVFLRIIMQAMEVRYILVLVLLTKIHQSANFITIMPSKRAERCILLTNQFIEILQILFSYKILLIMEVLYLYQTIHLTQTHQIVNF